MPKPEDVADGPGFHGFLQKRGQEHIKSVIYVKIVECDGQEEILLVNTQLTPVDATVNTLRIELIWITVIMILLSLGIALLISRQISKSHRLPYYFSLQCHGSECLYHPHPRSVYLNRRRDLLCFPAFDHGVE